MNIHLSVISYRKPLDEFLREITLKLKKHPPHKVDLCQDLAELPVCVLNAGSDVTRLDLVGHGAQALFELGGRIVLQADTLVPEEFTELNSILPEEASVRILGCNTGLGEPGLEMLKRLSEALGGREVFGTTAEIFPSDFGPQGLEAAFADSWLISSTATAAVRSSNRMQPTDPELEASRRWMELLPGYQLAGRGQPIVFPNLSVDYQGTQVSFAETNRLVLIHDEPGLQPLVMRWGMERPVPPLTQRLQPFGVH